MDLLFMNNGPAIAYVKAKPPELKASIVGLAIAMEKRAAPLRKDDDWLGRGALAEMRAGIEAGKTKEVPTPPGYYGETRAVEASPDWAPKFVASETYEPMQDQARSNLCWSSAPSNDRASPTIGSGRHLARSHVPRARRRAQWCLTANGKSQRVIKEVRRSELAVTVGGEPPVRLRERALSNALTPDEINRRGAQSASCQSHSLRA
jgi:hypothetical protein